jgi:hypothetical protein
VKGLLITLAVLALGGAALYWATLSHAGFECEVCIRYEGRERCASATGPSESEAEQAARMTACGVLASGVTDAISCQATAPFRRTCTGR